MFGMPGWLTVLLVLAGVVALGWVLWLVIVVLFLRSLLRDLFK